MSKENRVVMNEGASWRGVENALFLSWDACGRDRMSADLSEGTWSADESGGKARVACLKSRLSRGNAEGREGRCPHRAKHISAGEFPRICAESNRMHSSGLGYLVVVSAPQCLKAKIGGAGQVRFALDGLGSWQREEKCNRYIPQATLSRLRGGKNSLLR